MAERNPTTDDHVDVTDRRPPPALARRRTSTGRRRRALLVDADARPLVAPGGREVR